MMGYKTRHGYDFSLNINSAPPIEIGEMKPDMSWKWYDGCGHLHQWTKGKTKHHIKTAKTIKETHQRDGECICGAACSCECCCDYEDLHGEYTVERLVCRRCGEDVHPRYVEESRLIPSNMLPDATVSFRSPMNYEPGCELDINSEIEMLSGRALITFREDHSPHEGFFEYEATIIGHLAVV